MTAVAAPFGLKTIRHPSGYMRPQVIKITKALAEATPSMGRGTPIQLDPTGRLAVAANAADWMGIFLGVEYFDLNTGRPVVANRWVNGTLVLANGNDAARFSFTRDPNIIYEIQANGSSAIDDIGEMAAFVAGTIGTFDPITGYSSAALDVATLAAAQNMLRVVNLSQRIDNDWGDAFTILEVMVGRHQETANKAGV